MGRGVMARLEHEGQILEHERQIRTADVLGMITGAWLILAPAIIGFGSTGMVWSSVITGAVILAMAGLREYRLNMIWPDWVNMLAGVWAVLAPFVIAGTTTGAKWASVTAGLALLVFATWSVEASIPATQSHA